VTKREFIAQLQKKLQGLPKQEVEERISFYGEMIEDRMEEGMEEPQAVADVGTVEEISAQIISEIPLTKIAKERVKPKRRWETWEIVLLAIGSPIWLSLVVAVFAVGAFNLYSIVVCRRCAVVCFRFTCCVCSFCNCSRYHISDYRKQSSGRCYGRRRCRLYGLCHNYVHCLQSGDERRYIAYKNDCFRY